MRVPVSVLCYEKECDNASATYIHMMITTYLYNDDTNHKNSNTSTAVYT